MQPDAEFARATDPYRRELLVHCYRMLGSFHDAEDVVQETYLRAWRGFGQFEGRSSVRTWLYRIATRACLTALDSSVRRVLPSGIGAPTDDHSADLPRRPDLPWLEPLPDAATEGSADDPAAVAIRRDSTRLAFVAALQELPARQRAALVLRDVLAFSAAEVGELLDLSTASVTSALQRARTQLATATPSEEMVTMTGDIDEDLLHRFVAAFESADIESLTALFRQDIELEMPPIPTWFAGLPAVVGFFAHRVFAGDRRRLVTTRANGCPAAATYVQRPDGTFHAHSIQVLETAEGKITRIYAFLDVSLFACFALPTVLPAEA